MAVVTRITKRYKLNNYGFNILFKIIEEDTKEPKDLTGYDAVFKMWIPGSYSSFLEGVCNIHDADKGECIYLVKDGDFDELGKYYAEIELTKNGVLEDTETFEVVIYGTSPASQCAPPQQEFEYDGRIDLYIRPEATYSM